MADDVQLTDLEVIQRYSLAVRGATAPRAELVAALQADLAWLQGAKAKAPGRASQQAPAKAPAAAADASADRAADKAADKAADTTADRTAAARPAAKRPPVKSTAKRKA